MGDSGGFIINPDDEIRQRSSDDAPTSETDVHAVAQREALSTATPDLAPGDRLGPYRILERLGEGGFGSVHLAEQERPVRRKVALKVIKLGMDTKQVIARFEAERQALALMNHPNIARVLDAGATDKGRPYFVMDLVQGVPITEYCDRHNLALIERLRLFIDVCHAVQHAHQKGVIHRDLKPSNVLVGMQDSKPAPKIIDFGIAKATSQRLTERTLHTAQQHFVGTPQYMSPEQAEMSGLDIDTRSDVYSLGVLLYELLTGASPFDADRLKSASLMEIPRIIRDAKPQRASTRVSTMGGKASGVAEHRRASPAMLRKSLKGDLDWITLKAIEKDRTRRYQTAAELAQDLERFLHHEPVLAGPPSVIYRTRKFAQRHKAAFAGGSAIAAALLVGFVVSVWGFYRASVERDAARAAQQAAESARAESDTVTAFLSEMLAAADPGQMGRDVRVRDALDAAAARIGENFADQPAIEGRLRQAIGDTYVGLGLYDQADQHLPLAASLLEQAAEDHPERWLSARESLAVLRAKQGRFDDAASMLERVIDTRVERLGERHPDTLKAQALLGEALEDAARYADAERTLRAALSAQREVLGQDHRDTLATAASLAHVLRTQGRYDDAEPIYERTLASQQAALGREHPDTLATLRNLALLRRGQGRYDDAEPLYLEARDIQTRVLGADHPETLRTLVNLAWLYTKQSRFDEAETVYRDALTRAQAALGPEHPMALSTASSLAQLLTDRGALEEARELQTRTLEAQRRRLGPAHPDTIESMANLALLHRRLGDADRADRLYAEALELQRAALGPEHPTTLATMINLANVRVDQGRFDDAERLMRDTLDAQARTIGADHPNAIALRINLAGLLSRQNRLDEAQAMLREIVDVSSASLGEEHAYTMAAMVNLALAHRSRGEVNDAERMYLRVLDAQQRVLGETHVNTLRTMQNLAVLYRTTGRLDDAEQLMRQALAAREATLGADHRETLTAVYALAQTRADQGAHDEAAALYRRALDGRAAALGEDHSDTQQALSALANLLYQQGRPAEAADLFTRWMRSRQRVQGESDANALAMGYNLMLLRAQLEQPDKARELALDLLSIRRSLAEASEAAPGAVHAYAQLLLTCEPADLRDPDAAVSVARRACQLTDHRDPAMLDTLAQAQRMTGDTAAAIDTLKRALTLLPEGDGSRTALASRLAEYERSLGSASERDSQDGAR